MKKELQEEIYKCSKCGLCQSVCPIYIATKNEAFLPRGRYIILNNHINNGTKLSKEFLSNLDVCLNCNRCKEFCPSNIDSRKIFNSLKKKKFISFSLHLKAIFIFNSIKNIFNNPNIKTDKTSNIIYFEGCYNKYIDNKDKLATISLLKKLGYNVNRIISDCCGYPYFCEENKDIFKKNQTKIFNKIDENCKYIICSCDTCYEMLSKYENNEITSKLIRLDEFLKINNYEFKARENELYFKPLIKNEKTFIEETMETIRQKDIFSTMENFLLIKYPRFIKKININNNFPKSKTIITTCNISKWGLRKINLNIESLSEYINKD